MRGGSEMGGIISCLQCGTYDVRWGVLSAVYNVARMM
jgi:hypothetical protein